MAVTLGLRAERTDHLRVAADAAFTDVDVATFQLQRGVGPQALNRLSGFVLEEQRHDLGQATEADRNNDQHDQQANVLFNNLMLSHQSIPQAIWAAAWASAGWAARMVRQLL